MELLAKWIVVLFGAFIIFVGFLMLFAPERARATLRRAGSTNLINYTEITLRLVPAAALIVYADLSRFPAALSTLGWFMLVTSLVLYVVPRKIHHGFALRSAEVLRPVYVRLLSPFSFIFGGSLIYAVLSAG